MHLKAQMLNSTKRTFHDLSYKYIQLSVYYNSKAQKLIVNIIKLQRQENRQNKTPNNLIDIQ